MRLSLRILLWYISVVHVMEVNEFGSSVRSKTRKQRIDRFLNNEIDSIRIFLSGTLKSTTIVNCDKLLEKIAMLQGRSITFYRNYKSKEISSWLDGIYFFIDSEILDNQIKKKLKNSKELKQEILKRFPKGIFVEENTYFDVKRLREGFLMNFRNDAHLEELRNVFLEKLAHKAIIRFKFEIIDDTILDWRKDCDERNLISIVGKDFSEFLDQYTQNSEDFNILIDKMIEFIISFYNKTWWRKKDEDYINNKKI